MGIKPRRSVPVVDTDFIRFRTSLAIRHVTEMIHPGLDLER